MNRIFQWIGFAALGLVLTGCVAQEKYDALKMERDQYVERLAAAETEAARAREAASILQKQLEALTQGGTDQQKLMANLMQQNADLQARLAELDRKYQEVMGRPATGIALPPELDTALRQFADQNKDLLDYDAARGVVKFKSDVTFASGSAELTAKAREALNRFAQILNSPAASHYELMVAGHTDNQRVVNPNTLAAGHKDNWYLSAHRAISVGGALRSDGISDKRLGVLGYADQRPIASNAGDSGRAQNRRVEVLILPTTVGAPRAAVTAVNKDATGPQPMPNK